MKGFIVSLFALCLGAIVFAQSDNMQNMGNTVRGTKGATATSPADAGYMAAMRKMDKDMGMKNSGDPDIDFVRGMIPHHQGAIDMCKVELQYGKDPMIHEMCNNVIASQQREIVEMKKWLQQHQK